MTHIVDLLRADYEAAKIKYMPVTDYLTLCRDDPMAYASAAERMMKAIGKPEKLDTSADPRLSRIFLNRTVCVYPAFEDFYGMEETIERIVGYFIHSAQNLEERKQILYLLGPVGGGKCHKAGTLISMADGSWKKIEDIRRGDAVVSTDETTHLSTVNAVNDTFVIDDKPLWEVSTSRGLKVQGANTHRLLTNLGWKRIDELRHGDLIATARTLPFGNQRDDDAFIKVLGYILGDGHIPNASNITFTNFNETIIEDFSKAVSELGCIAKPQMDKSGLLLSYRINERESNLAIRRRFEDLKLNGTLSHTKFIPPFVFTLPEDQVALFLSRLYATDGWATIGGRCEIGYASASGTMANQVVALLSKFGIAARIDIKPTYLDGVRKQDSHVVSIKDRYHVMTFLAKIGIFGKDRACDEVFVSIINQRGHGGGFDILPKNLVIEATDAILASKKDGTSSLKNELRTRLDNNIGSRRGFVQYALEFFQNADALRLLAESDIYWDKVDTVSDLGRNEQMFDFSVEGLHNYVANGIISHNSSLAERLKELMETYPIYVLCFETQPGSTSSSTIEMSPVFESPLALFSVPRYQAMMQEQYNIDGRYLKSVLSPWAIKRLKTAGGDISRFCVARVMPSKLEQIGITKTEPGDENNQDISSLVGKTDIRKLEHFSQNDPDAYSFSGALCRSNQGFMEFVEMFKAPIKMLHPLLTATQEGNYMGTEAISAIPFTGIVCAHCFSDDTELLTVDGWRHHDDIEIGALLATLNRETGKLEYQPALKKFEQDYDGPMYHFVSHAMDHLVTPNHKMLYHTQYTDNWQVCTAEEYGETGKIIPVSAENDLPDYAISDDILRLMVWVVADASLAHKRVMFGFKNAAKTERLTTLLHRMDIGYDRTDGEVTSIHFDNPGLTKFIPEYYNELSARQGRIVLEEYAHTDGHRTQGQDYQLSSNIKTNIDRLQHIAIASGCKANQCSHTKQQYSPQYFLSIRVGITETRTDYAREKTFYEGKVFCFETPNHTLVARRNGKVLISSNSNEAEWQTFKNNKNNEAFIDRICVVKVPYCLRVAEEERIYRKMIDYSELKGAPCAPSTLEMIAQFSVLTRLLAHENSTPWSKMSVYNGENIKETDPRAKSVQEYRDTAGVDEGMTGTSTRFAFKVLSATFNHDHDEVAADPVHLMFTLEKAIVREQLGKEVQAKYLDFIKSELAPRYSEFIGNEIQTAYLEAYDDYGQTLFDRYISYADHWLDDLDFKDPDTGTMFDREYLNNELEKIEKTAGIANPKDFRQETVKFVLRQRSKERIVKWTSYEKLKKIVERKMFASVEALLPVISFSTKSSSEDAKKHEDFVIRMTEKGYTKRQVRRAVEWWMRIMKSN